MRICVLIKQVPDTESKFVVRGDGCGIDESNIKWIMNPYDEYAVEEALRLKERAGGEVVVMTAGPARAVEAVRQAMAMGADRAVHIDTGGEFFDPLGAASVLAAAIKKEAFDIVLAGKRSVDFANAQTHVLVAEKLGWPHATPAEKFSIADGFKRVAVTRPTNASRKELIELELPAVIGCEKGLNQPRFPTLPNIIKSKSKPVATLAVKDLLDAEPSGIEIVSLSLAKERQTGRVISGDAKGSAAELVRILREEAKVL